MHESVVGDFDEEVVAVVVAVVAADEEELEVNGGMMYYVFMMMEMENGEPATCYTTQEVFTKYPPISPKSTPGNQLAEQVSPPPSGGTSNLS